MSPSRSSVPSTPSKPTGLTGTCRPTGQNFFFTRGEGLQVCCILGVSVVHSNSVTFSTMPTRIRCTLPMWQGLKRKVPIDMKSACVCVGEDGFLCTHVCVGAGVGQGRGKAVLRLISSACPPSGSPGPGGRAELQKTVGCTESPGPLQGRHRSTYEEGVRQLMGLNIRALFPKFCRGPLQITCPSLPFHPTALG